MQLEQLSNNLRTYSTQRCKKKKVTLWPCVKGNSANGMAYGSSKFERIVNPLVWELLGSRCGSFTSNENFFGTSYSS